MTNLFTAATMAQPTTPNQEVKEVKDPNFHIVEPTKVGRNMRGKLSAETIVEKQDRTFEVSTYKGNRGIIFTVANKIQSRSKGNGATITSFDIFSNDPDNSIRLNEIKATCTEKKITELHVQALEIFKNYELRAAEVQEFPEVGNIVTGTYSGKLVVVEKINTQFGEQYKVIDLDTKESKTVSHVRNIKNKLGIGIYFHQDQFFEGDIEELKQASVIADKARQERLNAQAAAEKIAADEKSAYLAQFQKADVRKTGYLLKQEAAKAGNSCTVKYESYSGGNSYNVSYGPNENKDFEKLVNGLQYGRFDGMTDMYENSHDRIETILDSHILENFKYVHCDHEPEMAPAETKVKTEKPEKIDQAPKTNIDVTTLGIEIEEYSSLSFCLRGEDTKTIKDQLKELGGSYNRNLKGYPGWIFSNKRREAVNSFLQK